MPKVKPQQPHRDRPSGDTLGQLGAARVLILVLRWCFFFVSHVKMVGGCSTCQTIVVYRASVKDTCLFVWRSSWTCPWLCVHRVGDIAGRVCVQWISLPGVKWSDRHQGRLFHNMNYSSNYIALSSNGRHSLTFDKNIIALSAAGEGSSFFLSSLS